MALTRLQPSCSRDLKYGYIFDEKDPKNKDQFLFVTKLNLISLYNTCRLDSTYTFERFLQAVEFQTKHKNYVWMSDRSKKLYELHIEHMRKAWPAQITS